MKIHNPVSKSITICHTLFFTYYFILHVSQLIGRYFLITLSESTKEFSDSARLIDAIKITYII